MCSPILPKHSSNIYFSCNKYPLGSTENYDKIISSLSEGIQKFDSYFNEKSCDLSPYDVRQTQIVTMQIKRKEEKVTIHRWLGPTIFLLALCQCFGSA